MATKPNFDTAIWIDANTQVGLNTLPDRITDASAIINSSLFNLFNCVPGQRARIFQPDYGSKWMSFLQEPITDITAMKMQIYMVDSIKQWEPRIELNLDKCRIDANTNIPGYEVRIFFRMPNMSYDQQIQFKVQA
jgi:phage baseplate assembly protein W